MLINKLEEYSNTYWFLLPVIGKTKEYYPEINNCYLTPDNNIIIEFNFLNLNEIESLKSYFSLSKLFVDYKINENENKVYFKIKLPEKFVNDYELIYLSKYSKLSGLYKYMIHYFHNNIHLYGILNKELNAKRYIENYINDKIPYNNEFWFLFDRSKEIKLIF